MVGMNRYDPKDRRRQRRRNHVAKDLGSGKYRQRVIPSRRRVDNPDGSFFFMEEYYSDWNNEED